jgi:hypothetical protein
MKTELKGLDQVKKNIEQITKAARSLDGEIARLRFDPKDPSDVNRAVRELERKFDAKVAPYGSNSAVREIVTGLKKEFRKGLLKKAGDARRKLWSTITP